MPRPVYRTIYFNLDHLDDLAVLGWLLALPRSRRNQLLKAALRDGLPACVRRHHPEVVPLGAEAVIAALGAMSRPRTRRPPHSRWSARPALDPMPTAATPVAVVSQPRTSEPFLPAAAAPEGEQATRPVSPEARAEAERKLDRLLQQFAAPPKQR